jgi:hypothetical protein
MSDDDELDQIRRAFCTRTIKQAERLKEFLIRGDLSASEVETSAHSIAGTGGLLGFNGLSKAAAVVDDRFAFGEVPTREQVEALILQIERLG